MMSILIPSIFMSVVDVNTIIKVNWRKFFQRIRVKGDKQRDSNTFRSSIINPLRNLLLLSISTFPNARIIELDPERSF